MNKILTAVLIAGFGAQILKLIIFYFEHRNLKIHDLIATGGMPSSHAAFVTSLMTIIFLVDGPTTGFVISMVLAFIVIRDAVGVRRSVGKQGKELSKLFQFHKVRTKHHYAIGHTPMEVIM